MQRQNVKKQKMYEVKKVSKKMRRPKKRRSHLLDVLKKMPPLHHKIPDEDFDVEKSEMVEWMINQSEIKTWLGTYLKSIGYTKYDPETGLHVGIDYQKPCPHGHIDWDYCPDCRH